MKNLNSEVFSLGLSFKINTWTLPEQGEVESLCYTLSSAGLLRSPPPQTVHRALGWSPQVAGQEGRKVTLFVQLVVFLLLGW